MNIDAQKADAEGMKYQNNLTKNVTKTEKA
jgi:hypothetical protein